MKKLHLQLLAGTALATVAMMGGTPAQAQEGHHSGGYVGAGVGFATHDGCMRGCDDTRITGTELGFKALGGFQFHKNVAVEAAYHYFGKGEDTDTNTYESQGVSLAILGILPVNPGTDVFFKAGIIYANLERETSSRTDEESGVSPIVGVGVNFNFADSLTVRGEVEYVDTVGQGNADTCPGDVDIFAFTIDLIWRF